MPQELETKIKGVIGWNIAKMMTPCQQMFKILYDPNSFQTSPTKEQFNKWKEDFSSCLKILDLRLVDAPWLCGARMTIGDIIVFNDLSMFMHLCDLDPSHSEMAEHQNLMKWFKKMQKEPEINKLDTKYLEVLSKSKKTMPQ